MGAQRIVSDAVDQVGESVALNVSNANTLVVLGYEALAARLDPQVDDAVALFELVELFQDGDWHHHVVLIEVVDGVGVVQDDRGVENEDLGHIASRWQRRLLGARRAGWRPRLSLRQA